MKLFPAFVATAFLSLAGHVLAQDTSPASSEVKIQSVQVEKAILPGSKREWTKLIWKFTSTGAWSDGISFNIFALVQPPQGGTDDRRVLTAGLTYMNVPKGTSEGILYLSPNATLRYGNVLAVRIEPYKGDRPQEVFNWTGPGASASKDWVQSYRNETGILLPMRSTPWIMVDFERTPDLIMN